MFNIFRIISPFHPQINDDARRSHSRFEKDFSSFTALNIFRYFSIFLFGASIKHIFQYFNHQLVSYSNKRMNSSLVRLSISEIKAINVHNLLLRYIQFELYIDIKISNTSHNFDTRYSLQFAIILFYSFFQFFMGFD